MPAILDRLVRDFSYSIRALKRDPSFHAAAILTIALAIAANTTMFSVCSAVLFRPLPYPNPDRLVMLWEKSLDDNALAPASPANFADWRERSRAFEHLAALNPFPNYNLTGQGEPERLSGAAVSFDFFDALGVRFSLGRTFRPEEDQPGANWVAILSNELWVRRFHSDAGVIGRSIQLHDHPYTIVGVLPANFRFVAQAQDFQARSKLDVWTPLALDPTQLPLLRESHSLRVFGRLKPGVSVSTAQSEMTSVAQGLANEYPKSDQGRGVAVTPLAEQVTKGFKTGLLALQMSVLLVLLIAVVNVANLFLIRLISRRTEFAVRIAIGATGRRLAQQVLVEAGLLAALGGILGLLAGWWGTRLVPFLLSRDLPRIDEVDIDARVVLFTAGLSILAAVLFALAPLAHYTRLPLNDTLKSGGRTSVGGHSRLRSTLAAAEIALAVVLIVGAGLVVRSFWRLIHVSPGFQTEHILTAQVSLPWARYETPADASRFYSRALERIRTMPGVVSAGATANLPLSGMDNHWGFEIEGQPKPHESAKYRPITPGYIESMGIPLLAGRAFEAGDTPTSQRVVIINEMMARRYFPDVKPIGRRLRLLDPTMEWRTIVGVIGDVLHDGLDSGANPEIYLPDAQIPFSGLDMTLTVRTAIAPLALSSAIRSAVQSINPDQPVYGIRSMDEVVAASIGEPRSRALLLSGFAIIAVILASIGIYGVMTYGVGSRMREFGLRAALGADPGALTRLVLRQAGIVAATGAIIGLIGAGALVRLARSLLYGVGAMDVATSTLLALLLFGVALGAAYVPARRAARVDPTAVLRAE
jgi:putative ABC transport system permease protein